MRRGLFAFLPTLAAPYAFHPPASAGRTPFYVGLVPFYSTMTLESAVRCGELSCQRDSYLCALTTTVLSCEPRQAVAAAPAAKGKKKGGEKPPDKKLWDVVLGDSVLFPEGGGQPSDSGAVGGIAVSGRARTEGSANDALALPTATCVVCPHQTRSCHYPSRYV